MVSTAVAALVTIFLMAISGNSLPSRKSDLTKEKFESKINTNALIQILTKLINEIDASAKKQSTCGSGNLNPTLLNELLSSSTTNTSRVFIIYSNEVHSESLEFEHDIYEDARSDIRFSTPPTNVWINKAPCIPCVTDLLQTFSPPLPTIYLETFNFNETDVKEMVVNLGCVAKLQYNGFSVQAWNWTKFSTEMSLDSSCLSSVSTTLNDSAYTEKKSHFEDLLTMIHQLQIENDIKDWCA